jgi:hypothetical protein
MILADESLADFLYQLSRAFELVSQIPVDISWPLTMSAEFYECVSKLLDFYKTSIQSADLDNLIQAIMKRPAVIRPFVEYRSKRAKACVKDEKRREGLINKPEGAVVAIHKRLYDHVFNMGSKVALGIG